MKASRRKAKKSTTRKRKIQRGGNNPNIYLVIFDSAKLSEGKKEEIKNRIESKYKTKAEYVSDDEKILMSGIFEMDKKQWGYKHLNEKQQRTFEVLKIEFSDEFRFLLNNRNSIDARLTKLEYSFQDNFKDSLQLIPASHGLGGEGFFLFGMLPL
jgi:hypothetical protein